MSLRSKVSLWYTFAMLAITACSIFCLIALGNAMIQSRQKTELVNFITGAAQNMKIDDEGELSYSNEFKIEKGIINVTIYDERRLLISGFAPDGFPKYVTQVPNNTVITIKNKNDGLQWFVYQRTFELEDKIYYIRGSVVVQMLINDKYVYDSLSTALVIMPLLILVAIFGGSMITSSAFSHFARLSDMANKIQDGTDLSERIQVINENDEVGQLSVSFNQLFDRLQKAFEREKQFTDDASHELRTPITVILSECEYAKDIDNLEEMRDSIQVVHKQAKKMSSLVNQLLMLSRTGDLSKVINIDTFNFSELVEVVTEEMEMQAKQKNITIISGIDKNLYARGDQEILARMVINLISNAIKYGNENGWIKVSITHKGNDIVGMISDNGIGIEKDNLGKIFDRFYQVNPARTDSNMGLGLSMVKWIVDVHKGKIDVESTVGEGTVFKFVMPIYVENAELKGM